MCWNWKAWSFNDETIEGRESINSFWKDSCCSFWICADGKASSSEGKSLVDKRRFLKASIGSSSSVDFSCSVLIESLWRTVSSVSTDPGTKLDALCCFSISYSSSNFISSRDLNTSWNSLEISSFLITPSMHSCLRTRLRFVTNFIVSKYVGTRSDSSSQYRNIETVKLAFDKYSPKSPTSKNPIVFLHGLFGSKVNNRSVSKQLVKLLDRDIYCLDLRNHGESPHHPRHDYPSLAADVERFIEDNDLIDPILIGHSMGAKTAMGVCLRRPDLASLLISVDNAPTDFTAGGTGFSKFGLYIQQLKKIEAQPDLKSLKECDSVLAEVEPSLVVRQFLLTNMRKSPEGYSSRVPLDTLGKSLDNISGWPFNYEISRWTKPALFVRGTQSPYIADEYLNSIGLFFPRFDLKDVDSGHWVISERPAEFISVTVDWIQTTEDDI
ncbi:hypothetical protein OGAPHI_004649 [Ogataea philodendri]|uniref:AB hydrolase-1 domain-containing protein n=1 Tax=Ogataea philodendri TaxID=1378263 RepID=A0A9P8P310_9ASCO|nr:uncharacterized protein OGAPHI_004649 [Ogataea philodendri]KAH3664297.1 hypothetical protein OGAPHI_004649 [Ogataea philodendri]